MVLRFQLGLHQSQERFIGKLHGTAQGVAEQLAAELPQKCLAPHREQVGSQTVETVELRSIHGFHARVDRPVAQVLVAPAADRVEAFEREAERVDASMADGALGVAAMLFDELPDGQALGRGFVLGK